MTAAPQNLTRKILATHLVGGEMNVGEEVRLSVDQALLHDGTATLTIQALDAIGLDRIRVGLACQYIDHNLFQADFKNGDDHLFLQSAAERFGLYFSRPGNGISHPVHMERFGVPGTLLVGADSHTPAAGALGVLAIGAGSVEVATVLAGEPLALNMPEVWGVRLTGKLPDWVSAKDVILEMLRRHSVKGGVGRIIEYFGPGVGALSAMDRHVICNMGAELGATTSVFPADEQVRIFMEAHGRGDAFSAIAADANCTYDVTDEMDLSDLVPLIATPGSPDNVVPVREVAGAPVYQAYIGSSANPGYRDFAIAAQMVAGRIVPPNVSFDINPSSRQVLADLMLSGSIAHLIQAGGRMHQAGCNGCNGMGQAPASGKNSLRTTPRNFDGRSGNKDDRVYLCSPETATASALAGVITDPRDWGCELRLGYPNVVLPERASPLPGALQAPLPRAEAAKVQLAFGPNITPLAPIMPLPDTIEVPVLLLLGNDVSTDTISPAGAEALPFRSNLAGLAEFCFRRHDPEYVARAKSHQMSGGHALVGGTNYGQGSSREHAALCPQFLGLRLVLAKSFARIHQQNLINAGILPLSFDRQEDYDVLDAGDVLQLRNIHDAVRNDAPVTVYVAGKDLDISAHYQMSARQREIFFAGGLINWFKDRSN
ncbi:MAG: aconitate hydratase [Hyphomicrobiaceae bacterium]